MFKTEVVKRKIECNNHHSTWFKVLNNDAYFLDKKELFVHDGSVNSLKKYPEQDFNMIKSKNCVLVGNPHYGYDLIERDRGITHEPHLKNFKLPFDSDSNEVYFFERDSKLKKYKSGLYSTKNRTFVLIKDSILNIDFLKDDIFLNVDNARVDVSGNKIWELALEGFEIKRNIGIWQNQLIVACSNHILLSLDVNTGKVFTRWHELKGFEVGQFYKDVLPNPANFVLDGNANKLIGVFHTYYFEIDLITKQISYENLESELKSHSMIAFRPMGNNPFTADHLFLTGHVRDKAMPDIDFNCVLALNRHTRNVDWSYTFRDTSIGINIPQITDTHLYQIDVENNLYIFEKQ